MKNKFLPFFVLINLTILFSGCNLPQATGFEDGTDSQRQTEIAGILNPESLNPTPQTTPAEDSTPEQYSGDLLYTTQQGDTLPALAARFEVNPSDIQAAQDLSQTGLLAPGLTLWIPDTLEDSLSYDTPFFPDSAVTYGPTVGDFNAADFAYTVGGFLAGYTETVNDVEMTGPDIIQTVAMETSTNPRLLLAILEFQSGWVFDFSEDAANNPYPIGFGAGDDKGLYKELMITAKVLAQGFYGWRAGTLTTLQLSNHSESRLPPSLNAGSAALIHLFATLYSDSDWEYALFSENGFLVSYTGIFGEPWSKAALVEPYLLADTQQPDITLPFLAGEAWSLTGGPHITWQTGTPRGAVDFAPIIEEAACAVSVRWVTTSAPGLVVRSDRGVVALDLDGDGYEGTGWVLIYLHIAAEDRVPVGTWLEQDAPIGHPSCEGGQASGTHVHFARKYNGEWIGVGDPLPLLLGGWVTVAGEQPYQGMLINGEMTVYAAPNGIGQSTITREE